MDNHIRYCDKHPKEQMALTLDGFVCDICEPEPPKKQKSGRDNEGFVLCPICTSRANTANRNGINIWEAGCVNFHKWVPDGGWKIGDKTNNLYDVYIASSVSSNTSIIWKTM